MTKLLIVGHFVDASLEHHYVKYLSKKMDVHTFGAENMFDDYYRGSMLNKVFFKTGFSNIQQKIGEELIGEIKKIQPDIIWVFKGMRLLPEVLREIKKLNIPLANYNPDHPFYFSSKGSGNENITDSIGLYDLHFCYDQRVAERIEKEFNIPTAILPFGFELPEPVYESSKNEPEIKAACFIGACDEIRIEHVLTLANAGVPVNVYGQYWSSMLPRSTSNITVNDGVYGDAFWKAMRRYRVQLNVFKPHNIGCHNMRSFEIPAIGGIMLAPDSADHQRFFEDGQEAFFYRDKTEMVWHAKKILDLPENEAMEIRGRARSRSVRSGYSYERRSGQVFRSFSEIMELV